MMETSEDKPFFSLERSRHPWSMGHRIRRGLWMMTWTILGRPGPKAFTVFRVWLLRLFGARIGRGCLVCGNIRILMPWNLELGDFSVLGHRVDVYNFGMVRIGPQSCISQGVWLCTGTHDHRKPEFPLTWKSIHIGHSVWVAAEAFVHPGTRIGDGCVVGARAVVSGNLQPWRIYAGNPGLEVGIRRLPATIEKFAAMRTQAGNRWTVDE